MKDANNLVLFPVERMIMKLNKIRQNPFEAIRMSEEELRKDHAAALKGKRSGRNRGQVAALSEDQIMALARAVCSSSSSYFPQAFFLLSSELFSS